MRIAAFTTTHFSELEQQAADIPWELYLKPGTLGRVQAAVHHCRLHHTDGIAERVRAGVDKRLAPIPVGEAARGRRAAGVRARRGRPLHRVARQQRGAPAPAGRQDPPGPGAAQGDPCRRGPDARGLHRRRAPAGPHVRDRHLRARGRSHGQAHPPGLVPGLCLQRVARLPGPALGPPAARGGREGSSSAAAAHFRLRHRPRGLPRPGGMPAAARPGGCRAGAGRGFFPARPRRPVRCRNPGWSSSTRPTAGAWAPCPKAAT